MKKIYVGKYVNTHGINGEIRIKSNFKYKNKVFVENMKIYLEDNLFIINSHRIHKDYDMLTLKGITNINDILNLKGSNVYVDKDSLKLSNHEYLDDDLIGLDVFVGNIIKGKVEDIVYLKENKKLFIVNKKYVPFELIKKIDFDKKNIILEEVDGLL